MESFSDIFNPLFSQWRFLNISSRTSVNSLEDMMSLCLTPLLIGTGINVHSNFPFGSNIYCLHDINISLVNSCISQRSYYCPEFHSIKGLFCSRWMLSIKGYCIPRHFRSVLWQCEYVCISKVSQKVKKKLNFTFSLVMSNVTFQILRNKRVKLGQHKLNVSVTSQRHAASLSINFILM